MDIQDLDFKELLQKPVKETVFAYHFDRQLSNQELETMGGGAKSKTAVVGVSEPSWRWCEPGENYPGNHLPICLEMPGPVASAS